MQRLNISQIRLIITLIAVTGVILVIFRSKYELRNSERNSADEFLSESTQTQLESVVSKMGKTQRKLEKYKDRCIALREAYRKQQVDFPKAYSRYTGELTASIERAIRGEDPRRIPELEKKLKARQQKIAAHEMRLNNLQPAIEDMLHRINDRISQIYQLNGQISPVKRQVSETQIEPSSVNQQEYMFLHESYEQLSVLIQDDLLRWDSEIKDHQFFLRQLSRFIQSLPE